MADEIELLQAQVKIRGLERSILQARLDQALARKRCDALQADIDRYEKELVEAKAHLENLERCRTEG